LSSETGEREGEAHKRLSYHGRRAVPGEVCERGRKSGVKKVKISRRVALPAYKTWRAGS